MLTDGWKDGQRHVIIRPFFQNGRIKTPEMEIAKFANSVDAGDLIYIYSIFLQTLNYQYDTACTKL